MELDFFYNTLRYLNSMLRGDKMELDAILGKYEECKKYHVDDKVSGYLYYVDEKRNYVQPSFENVKTNNKISTLNPTFMLFSAPGAVGKSSLAKHIANRFGALYWDLAEVKVGTNSFAGSILSAVGASKYSKFIGDLSLGKVLLTIDAFDEAEIISGRRMLGDFLKDISECLDVGKTPSVLLFSRTETAQFIASFCADNSIPLIHYEIGFFDDSRAIKFVESFVKNKDKDLTKADDDCINEYYHFIKDNIPVAEQKRFLGYAPVLQAIAQQIFGSPNRQKLKNELSGKKDCASIIVSIMESLLRRERDKKVIPALKKKWSEQYPEFEDWEKLYSDEEQLARIVYYILFGDTEYSNYTIENFPVPMIEDYQEALSKFLPQHPYLGNDFNEKVSDTKTNFVGPAFRDYTMAQLLLKSGLDELVKMYLGELKGRAYTPSKLLFDCYCHLSEGTVQSNHITHIYDSFRAKATAMEKPYLQCSEFGAEEKSYAVIFGMLNQDKLVEVEEVEMALGVVGSSLEFEQVVNLSIDTPSLSVKLGRKGDEMRITNSSIICKEIIWGSKDVTIESYSPEGCLLVSYHSMSGEHPIFEIVSKEELKVCAPNINQYSHLVGYKYDFEETDDLDIMKFIYALRCILMEFRAHKKDTLAKTTERIENVIVGGSKIKQKVLEYLKYSGIVYPSAHLLKINEEMLKKKGIFFSAVTRMNTKELIQVYDDFNGWLKVDDKSDLKI